MARRIEELHRQYVQSFFAKHEQLRRLWDALCSEEAGEAQARELHLHLHRLSGSAGAYGFEGLAQRAHELERDWTHYLDAEAASRPPAYAVCMQQAGRMAELFDELLVLAGSS
jgi:HPt (histidine-containing phosphotransfer) domain-containing protein